ncbi:hypothetical protein [Neptunicella sp. SCSIO 80796]|uniref:hypothetical protein n=1 Tax=Neptunicella plasticusilytica TaxID=3117012 RepID=UPI003A4DADFB
MCNNDIPQTFFDMLPIPIAITKELPNDLNFPLVFLNQAFTLVIGWDLTDIPDKNTWWKTVYPDKDYAKVVERQWELAVLSAQETGEGFISIDVNLQTKYHGVKRFKVYTQIDSVLMPGYYVVAFQAL